MAVSVSILKPPMPLKVTVRSTLCLIAITSAGWIHSQVTTRTDPVGKLLNEWHAAGAAAGLEAITYENRDGGHSLLDTKEWPQLQVRAAVTGDTGPSTMVRPVPLLGNCSMASGATQVGSLPRLYMVQPEAWNFLAAQYADNNHFVYPEHQDYDRGWNGRGGWGDLYPANTPCITICRGSSFKDQIFVRAFLAATAAFSPETQKLVFQKQMLAPTLQMLLRRCYKAGATAEDYFSGKRHPPVFDGDLVEEEKMVRLAHEMTLDQVPPVARLQVTGESQPEPGKHFFELDAVKDGKLGTSPFAVGRVFRGSAFAHEMLLSAQASVDAQARPLTFKWVLLQGELSRVRIETAPDGVTAKVTIAWHPEGRGADGIQTHRVDIGVFAHNGATWSAPAILSFYMLPNEARFYNGKGRVEEICYEAGNPDPGLPATTDLRWMALGWRLGKAQRDPGIALLAHSMSEIAVVRLQGLVEELSDEQDAWRKLSANPKRKEAADKALSELQEMLRKGLEVTFDQSGKTLAQAFDDGINAVASVPDLYLAGQDVIPGLVKASGKPAAVDAFSAARQRLLDFGILKQDAPGHFTPIVNLSALTAGEKYHLAQFHLTVLNLALLPQFIDRVEAAAYVDLRLTSRKPWRDLHHYSEEGKPVGWTRIMGGRTYEFDSEGRLLPKGRGGPAVPVKYVREEKSGKLVFLPR